eukprot:TRINITY_DN7051_c0_g1_i2.p1 TRINITY_DN7051_c0_g1~~TRINITY_DN7051_c0_g1_i2.p1  ORF type:complete len:846 (+),score=172.47 TRINITY_DN7051_c0_g1_i2:247-2538(+)
MDAILMQAREIGATAMLKLFKTFSPKNYIEVINKSLSYHKKSQVNLLNKMDNREFSQFATDYGNIIISEKNLPVWEKSIKPLGVGGIAGGEKFRVRGLFFKFAKDTQIGTNSWMYGSYKPNDGIAMKAMGNDLSALEALEKCEASSELYLPKMCLVDKNGYRLCCMSDLPIRKDTLVYGTCDGGNSIFDASEDPHLLNVVQRISKEMNLTTHNVEEKSTKKNKTMELAVDVEIHSHDDKYFALDFARAIPPNDIKMPLVNIFRFEYHQNYNPDLSPDIFVAFGGRDNKNIHDPKAKAAIEVFETMVESDSTMEYMIQNITSQIHVRDSFHMKGINLRYMGRVLSKLADTQNSKSAAYFILTEMLFRSIKSILQKLCRKRPLEVEKYLVDYLNMDMSLNIMCESTPVIKAMLYKYPLKNIDVGDLFQKLELDGDKNIWGSLKIDKVLLGKLTSFFTGFKLNKSLKKVETKTSIIKWSSDIRSTIVAETLNSFYELGDINGTEDYIAFIPPSTPVKLDELLCFTRKDDDHGLRYKTLNIILSHFHISKDYKYLVDIEMNYCLENFFSLDKDERVFCLNFIDAPSLDKIILQSLENDYELIEFILAHNCLIKERIPYIENNHPDFYAIYLSKNNDNPITYAVRNAPLDAIDEIIKLYPDFNVNYVLNFSCKFRPECVKLLIKKNIPDMDINSFDGTVENNTPMLNAIIYNPTLIPYLLENGANPNCFNFDGDTPLVKSIIKCPSYVDILLEGGADVNWMSELVLKN